MTGLPEEQHLLVQEWFDLAEEDYLLAEELCEKATSHFRAVCFHSQQAAEKFLKALLANQGISFGRTHDIESLVNQLPSNLADPLRQHDILDLTEYAVDTRYPGQASIGINLADAQRALDAARVVRDLTRQSIKR
jgi:HEPN domain-containing protein